MYKRALFLLYICAMCHFSGYSVTLELRDGSTVEGEIIRRDNVTLTLKTSDGERVLKWRRLTNKSIQDAVPELFNELKQKALERRQAKKEETERKMKEKGMVKVNGTWMTPEDAKYKKYRFISMRVTPSEKAPHFETYEENKYGKRLQSRFCNGVINIDISGMDSHKKYDLKIKSTQHLEYFGNVKYRMEFDIHDESKTNTITQSRVLTGKNRYQLSFDMPKYEQRVDKSTYRDSDLKYGIESKGFDVTIWIDGDKVYEIEKNGGANYYFVGKL